MKDLVKRYAERIDAASLRGRVMVFLALTLVLMFVANGTLLQPLRAKQKRLAADNAQSQKELGVIQAELRKLLQVNAADPDAANRRRQAALREEVSQLNARIAQEQKRFTTPERMRGVLEEMLERNKGLSLVDLKSLPSVPISPGKPGAPSAQGLFRHGVELTVRGSYADLYQYLRTLEQSPTQLYWGRAELAVGEHPSVTLKLVVFTVSFDRAWLIV